MTCPAALALIDGEHYPPVVVAALADTADRFDFRGALFLGGTEKIRAAGLEERASEIYGLPVLFAEDLDEGLRQAIVRFRPEVVVDLSDEPVLGYRERFRLISRCLAERVTYVGSDFHFSPVNTERVCAIPSLSIIGTGKRVGKTAISGFMARTLKRVAVQESGEPGIVVVAMGRGGPAEPELVDGSRVSLTVADLLSFSREGRHAASDCYEDAVLSGVVTVGCRRSGGGKAGEPFFSNVARGVGLANDVGASFLIVEGSGASIPPVESDVRVLVAGAGQRLEYIDGYLGAYRLLLSDVLVLTMAEEPLATAEKVRSATEAAREVNPDLVVIPTVFRPRPTEPVEGRRVAFFTTAPAAQERALRRYLEERFGCRVTMYSSNLANRAALRRDLEEAGMAGVDAILTEIKAAAIDVVAEAAVARGLEVVFVDNEPVEVSPAVRGDLEAVTHLLYQTARRRFETRV
jgi:cyclic 2,3-diphosphoglycerate synthetase